jgi:hypothetical protein
MKLLMFVILFLFVGAFFIISNEKIQINSGENFNYFFKQYCGWFDKLIGNAKTTSGYLIKMEWLPGEEE